MNLTLRILASIVAFVATGLFSYWLVFVQILPDSVDYLALPLALLTAVLAARFIWRAGFADTGLLAAAVRGGILVGGLAFVGGFFGPMILSPGANQGPMLGIFVTGPLGFVVGCIAGTAWQLALRRRRVRSP